MVTHGPKSTMSTKIQRRWCYSVEALRSRALLVSEFQRNRVDTMTFVSWRSEPFAFEDMPQMPTTGSARNLCSDHTIRAILMTGHSTRNTIKERGPPTPALELGGALVERCPTPNARISPLILVVFVFSSTGGFCALLAENPKLFWGQDRPPF